MLQRIQTLFLLGVIAILITVSFWGDFCVFMTKEGFYYFSAQGMIVKTLDNKEIMEKEEVPFYLLSMALAAFALYIMFKYKNLNRQLAYVKIFWGLYFVALISVVVARFYILPSYIDAEILRSNFSYNFYLMVIGLPFAHLSMVYIGRDKNKIDSLNRLR